MSTARQQQPHLPLPHAPHLTFTSEAPTRPRARPRPRRAKTLPDGIAGQCTSGRSPLCNNPQSLSRSPQSRYPDKPRTSFEATIPRPFPRIPSHTLSLKSSSSFSSTSSVPNTQSAPPSPRSVVQVASGGCARHALRKELALSDSHPARPPSPRPNTRVQAAVQRSKQLHIWSEKARSSRTDPAEPRYLRTSFEGRKTPKQPNGASDFNPMLNCSRRPQPPVKRQRTRGLFAALCVRRSK